MEQIKRVALLPNPGNSGALECAGRITSILAENGYEVWVHSAHAELLRGVKIARDHGELAEICDVFVAVGGDGTILHAAKHAALTDRPVLGVNMGRVGYLAGLEQDQLELLPRMLAGEARTERRRLLRVTVGGKESYALNDAVLSGEFSKLLDYRVTVNGTAEYPYRADGLILATPTGSTAYSLSAGGPVVDPALDCMICTAICPHSLFDRSVIYGSGARLSVQVTPGYGGRVLLTVDGAPPVILQEGDVVEAELSEKYVRFFMRPDACFFDAVNKKLIP